MAALSGSLPDATLTPAQRQEQANAARIAELVAAQVYGTPGTYSETGEYIPGQAGNITAQMELASLDPQLAAQLKTAATPPAPAMNPADAAVFQRFGYSVPVAS